MRRKIAGVLGGLLAAAAIGGPAGVALADNTGTPPGPPLLSGNPDGTFVVHCAAATGGRGVLVIHPDGTITGNGNCGP